MKAQRFLISYKINRLSFFVVLFLLLSLPIYATNWYVNKNATGLNNGTSWTNAWKSFSVINWSLINPGDFIYISGGTDSIVYYETLKISEVQGTAANPITVIAGKYAPNPTGHSGRVIIDGGNNTRARGVWIVGTSGTPTSYIVLKGIESRRSTASIHIEDYCNVITIDSCYAYDFYDLAGVFTNGAGQASTFSGIDSVTIKNCTIISPLDFGEQTDGIYIGSSTNTVIHDNYIRMRNQHPTAHIDGIQSIYSQGFVIYNNVLISDSVLTGGGMPIILRSGDKDGTHKPVIIYNNFCYMGGMWGPPPGTTWSMVFNTHDGDQCCADPSPTYLFNNTIVGNGPQVWGAEIDYFGSDHDGVFLNNIVAQYGAGGGIWGNNWASTMGNGSGGAIDVDSVRNNLYWREWGDVKFSGSWTNGQTTNGEFGWTYWTNTLGGTGIKSNPLFVYNFGDEPDQGVLTGELQATSPAINAGEDLTYLKNYLQSTYGIIVDIEHDINGITRDTENPTMGAYEYVAAGPDLTPPRVTGATLSDSVTLVVNFSETLDQATAEDENNYSINNNISIFNASLSGTKVTLQTSPHSPGSYAVTIVNVEDLAGNVISSQANSADYEYEIQIDVIPPSLKLIQIIDPNEIILDFSEPLDPNSAQDLGNYTISGQIDVLNASLSEGGKRVCLSTTSHIIESVYTIELQNLADIAGNVISSSSNSSFYKFLNFPSSGWHEYLIESVTASSTSDTNTSPSKTLDGLGSVDPDPNSRWATLNMPQWIQYDLGTVKSINFIPISFYRWDQGRLYQYSIQISADGSQWTEIISNATSSNQEWTINEFSSVEAQFVRIICLSNNEADWAGLWETRILGPDTMTDVNTTTPVVDFELFQNYPNPFNPSTSIKYTIPSAQYASFKVFDVLGNEVVTLFSEVKPAGSFEIVFNANNLPSGVYFYRLQAGSFVETKKMILLK